MCKNFTSECFVPSIIENWPSGSVDKDFQILSMNVFPLFHYYLPLEKGVAFNEWTWITLPKDGSLIEMITGAQKSSLKLSAQASLHQGFSTSGAKANSAWIIFDEETNPMLLRVWKSK